MCLLPRDKLDLYLKSLFHTTLGERHARLPYNYLGIDNVDRLSSVLGKSEISFTFTLSDNIEYNIFNTRSGSGNYELGTGRTMDIGQEKGSNTIGLVTEKTRILPGFQHKSSSDDPRIK
jgi:hypothetical protein